MTTRPRSADRMIGRQIGNFRVERLLGEGGMGSVYAARHHTLDEWRAIKVLLPRFSQNPDVVARFLGEAKATSASKSDYIVRIHDLGVLDDQDESVHFIAMEMLQGHTLHEIQKPVADLLDVLSLVLQIAMGLQVAHDRGIVHRDIKPGNLFLADDPAGRQRVKIVDFGLAKLTTESLSTGANPTQGILGTPTYMAPEQAKAGTYVTHLADVYALGAVAYELVSGRPPFSGGPYEVLQKKAEGPPPDVRTLRADLPEAWAAVIHSSLSTYPEARPQSARDFAELLVGGLPGGRRVAAELRFEMTGHARLPSAGGTTQALSAAAPSTLSSATGQSSPSGEPRPRKRWSTALGAGGAMAVVGAAATALIASSVGGNGSDRVQAAQAPVFDASVKVAAAPPDAKPAPTVARLRVEATPAEARVLIDDVFVGSAPVVVEKPVGRSLVVRVEAEGHTPSSQTTTLTRDETLRVELVPEPVAKPKAKRKRKARDPEREGFDTWNVPKRKKPLWR